MLRLEDSVWSGLETEVIKEEVRARGEGRAALEVEKASLEVKTDGSGRGKGVFKEKMEGDKDSSLRFLSGRSSSPSVSSFSFEGLLLALVDKEPDTPDDFFEGDGRSPLMVEVNWRPFEVTVESIEAVSEEVRAEVSWDRGDLVSREHSSSEMSSS